MKYSAVGVGQFLIMSPTEKTAYRDQLYCEFAHGNWSVISSEERLDRMQGLENYLAYEQGRPPYPVEYQDYSDLSVRTYGEYDPNEKTILVNQRYAETGTFHPGDERFDDWNLQCFDTICHEGRHGTADYFVDHPDECADKDYLTEICKNRGKYFTLENDRDRYFIQPEERYAWSYGFDRTSEAIDIMEKNKGPEPGKTEYQISADNSNADEALIRAQRLDPYHDVLEDMDRQMVSGCERKGIFYDYANLEKNQQIINNTNLQQDVLSSTAKVDNAQTCGEEKSLADGFSQANIRNDNVSENNENNQEIAAADVYNEQPQTEGPIGTDSDSISKENTDGQKVTAADVYSEKPQTEGPIGTDSDSILKENTDGQEVTAADVYSEQPQTEKPAGADDESEDGDEGEDGHPAPVDEKTLQMSNGSNTEGQTARAEEDENQVLTYRDQSSEEEYQDRRIAENAGNGDNAEESYDTSPNLETDEEENEEEQEHGMHL